MRHVWSILCSRALIDQNRKISLIEVLDAVDIPVHESEKPPEDLKLKLDGSIQLVTSWYRSELKTPETGESRNILVSPGGHKQPIGEAVVDLEDTTLANTVLGKCPPLEFHGFGLYNFQIQKRDHPGNGRWITSAKIPLQIRGVGKKPG